MTRSRKTRSSSPAFIEYEFDPDELADFFSGKRKGLRPCKVTRHVITPQSHARALRRMGVDPALFRKKDSTS